MSIVATILEAEPRQRRYAGLRQPRRTDGDVPRGARRPQGPVTPTRLRLVHVLSREQQDVELLSGRIDAEQARPHARRPAAGRGRSTSGSSAARCRWSSTCAQALVDHGVAPTARSTSSCSTPTLSRGPPRRSPAVGRAAPRQVTFKLDGRTSDARAAARRRGGARRGPAGAVRRCRSRAGAASAAPAAPSSSRARSTMDVNYALEPEEIERGLRADLPVAPDVRRASSSTTTRE